jgi:hypothetical protein
MSKSNKCNFKREPKHRGGEMKHMSSLFPACCGLTCCSCFKGNSRKASFERRRAFRSARRLLKKAAISEQLQEMQLDMELDAIELRTMFATDRIYC